MAEIDTYSAIPTSAYVHIPFCRRRCFYCDFPVSVVGDRLRGETSGTISHYVDILCQEIAVTPNLGQPLKTIFFGGGTPSLLSVKQLHLILTALEQHFGICAEAEISMEIDPGTFDLEHLQGYVNLGVNRVSLGVQAFQEELLVKSGRSHTVADVYSAVELIRHSQVPDFNLDLISGLPHQTLDQWQTNLEKAIALAPTHISVYDLIIEPVTAFARQYQPGNHPLPSDESTVKMYQTAQQILTTAGYEHYEICNYAQSGHQCQHNRVYWENRPYYAFGMGAASYVQGQRFTRPRKTSEYYPWVQQLIADKGVIDCLPTPENEVLLDTLMLGLRLADGVSLSTLTQKFGKKSVERIHECLQPYHQKGWVKIVTGSLRLTDPQGFLFSNVVLADLFSEFESA